MGEILNVFSIFIILPCLNKIVSSFSYTDHRSTTKTQILTKNKNCIIKRLFLQLGISPIKRLSLSHILEYFVVRDILFSTFTTIDLIAILDLLRVNAVHHSQQWLI